MKVQYYGNGVTTSFATPNSIGYGATVTSSNSAYKPVIASQSTTEVVLTVAPPLNTRLVIRYDDVAPEIQSDTTEWIKDASGRLSSQQLPDGSVVYPLSATVDENGNMLGTVGTNGLLRTNLISLAPASSADAFPALQPFAPELLATFGQASMVNGGPLSPQVAALGSRGFTPVGSPRLTHSATGWDKARLVASGASSPVPLVRALAAKVGTLNDAGERESYDGFAIADLLWPGAVGRWQETRDVVIEGDGHNTTGTTTVQRARYLVPDASQALAIRQALLDL